MVYAWAVVCLSLPVLAQAILNHAQLHWTGSWVSQWYIVVSSTPTALCHQISWCQSRSSRCLNDGQRGLRGSCSTYLGDNPPCSCPRSPPPLAPSDSQGLFPWSCFIHTLENLFFCSPIDIISGFHGNLWGRTQGILRKNWVLVSPTCECMLTTHMMAVFTALLVVLTYVKYGEKSLRDCLT